MSPKFDIVMRGYDIHEVEQLVSTVDDALNSGTEQTLQAALDGLHISESERFRIKVRGYSRPEVDSYIDHHLRTAHWGAGQNVAPRQLREQAGPPLSVYVVVAGVFLLGAVSGMFGFVGPPVSPNLMPDGG
jgi:hypothetical protein